MRICKNCGHLPHVMECRFGYCLCVDYEPTLEDETPLQTISFLGYFVERIPEEK